MCLLHRCADCAARVRFLVVLTSGLQAALAIGTFSMTLPAASATMCTPPQAYRSGSPQRTCACGAVPACAFKLNNCIGRARVCAWGGGGAPTLLSCRVVCLGEGRGGGGAAPTPPCRLLPPTPPADATLLSSRRGHAPHAAPRCGPWRHMGAAVAWQPRAPCPGLWRGRRFCRPSSWAATCHPSKSQAGTSVPACRTFWSGVRAALHSRCCSRR
jgi:hypothetical protein